MGEMTKAEQVIELICSQCISMRKACDSVGITPWTFLRAIEQEGLSQQYARSMEARADSVFDEILEIADDTSNDNITVNPKNGDPYDIPNTEWIARSKVKIDARKWVIARMNPRKYGDRIETVITEGKSLPEWMQEGDK